MTRPIDQADVDAVLREREGEKLDSVHWASMQLMRQSATATLNAAVALGWTPPPRPGDAELHIGIFGLPPGEWHDHPLVDAIADHAFRESEKYEGVSVFIVGGREPEEVTPDAR